MLPYHNKTGKKNFYDEKNDRSKVIPSACSTLLCIVQESLLKKNSVENRQYSEEYWMNPWNVMGQCYGNHGRLRNPATKDSIWGSNIKKLNTTN